jgi:hypothetical protein
VIPTWWRGLRSLGYIVGSGGGQGRVGGAHAVPIQEETGAGNGRVSSRSKQRGEKEEGAGGGGLPLGENGVAARLTECSRLIRTII